MNEKQLAKIEETIRLYAETEYWQGKVRRQALQCSVGPDGLHILPKFVAEKTS